MRKLSALFILSLISLQAFYNLGVTVYWLTHHAYIAAVLCENRDKPMEHCDGKCYLKKKLADTTDSTPLGQNLPKSLKKNIEISEFVLENGWVALKPEYLRSDLIPTIPGCCSIEPADRVFRPPT